MHLSPLAAYQFQEGVGDEAKRNPFGNAEGKRHHQQRQKGRDGLRNVVPINVDDIFEHQAANNNQRRGNDGIEDRIFADRVSAPTILISGLKNKASSIRAAVTMLVKPVRPPAEIPDALSM